MAQWVKEKPDDLGSIPEIHRKVGETRSTKLSSGCPSPHALMHAHTSSQMLITILVSLQPYSTFLVGVSNNLKAMGTAKT